MKAPLPFSAQNSSSEIGWAALFVPLTSIVGSRTAFGTALILLLFLLRDGFGNTATAWAAIFLAVSPAMVFYSRYFIHEMLLVFFTLLTLAAGWRYAKKRSVLWSVVTGAGLGLMFATNPYANVVTIVQPAQQRSLRTIDTTDPLGVVVDTAQHRIYVANNKSSTLTIIGTPGS